MDNFVKFKKTILINSIADTYEHCLDEWVEEPTEQFETYCICGKRIYNVCFVRNKYNGVVLPIGNICIKKFMNKDMDWFFDGLKQLKKNIVPNVAFLEYCHKKGLLYDNQYKELLIFKRTNKRKIPKQKEKWFSSIFYKLKKIHKIESD